jgi:hypothetical protein
MLLLSMKPGAPRRGKHEVETLARARGVAMPETVVEDAILLAESYNKKFKPSMLRDLEWRDPWKSKLSMEWS